MLATILIFNDPAGICQKERIEVEEGTLLLGWLIEKYGPDGFTTATTLYSGAISKANELELSSHIDTGYPVSSGEVVTIIHSPCNLDPLTILYVVLTVVSIAASIILKPSVPSIPEFTTAEESPNNKLTGQTNIARPLQRIPDLFGRLKVFPDLIAKTYSEFINHIKYINEYLCIGRGEHLVEDLKSGDTLVSDIQGAAVTVFEPFTSPAALLDVEDSNEVNGQELYGPNDTGSFNIVGANIIFTGAGTFVSTDTQMSQFNNLAPGDTFTVSNTSFNNFTYTFVSFEGTGGFLGVIMEEDGVLEVATSTNIVSSAGRKSEIGPFVVPGDPDVIWIDMQCPKGLQNANALLSVVIEAHVQETDGSGTPVGAIQDFSFTMSDDTIDPRFYTFKMIPNNPGNPHEISVERLTNTSTAADYFDQTKWTRLAGVEDVGVSDFGNVTTVFLTTKATEQATTAQRREFNAIVTRKLRTYDTGTQTIDETLTATARMADAALEILTDSEMGNKDPDDLDLDSLYEIQDRLDSDAIYGDTLGRFSYSFSSNETSVGDDLDTCLNAARCFGFREGKRVLFRRDEEQDSRTMLLNQRNKSPEDEIKERQFYRPDDPDGIELEWVEEDTGDPAIVLFPEPSGGTRPKKIEAAGIRNYDQAWNRANYEWQRLLYQRTTVEVVATKDGLILDPNDRIANVDGTNIEAQGGEVRAISGLTVETTEIVDFDGDSSGTVILRDDEGAPSTPIECEPRTDGVNGFVLDELPSFDIMVRGENDYQIGTLYSFFPGSEDNHLANDYLVREIAPSDDGYVRLRMINYAAEIYAPDTETPTPRSS